VPVKVTHWSWKGGVRESLRGLAPVLGSPGVVSVAFRGVGDEAEEIPRRALDAWTSSRAVTVARLEGQDLADPTLGLALCADLVYLERSAALGLPGGDTIPSPGLVWAARRAGHGALRRVLLGDGRVSPEEALALGLVHGLVDEGEALPLPLDGSLRALTAARDLLRSGAAGVNALALEAAAFRLLFAGGDPREGAAAFLERRSPHFTAGGGTD